MDLLRKFICFVFGHKYFVSRVITPQIRELGCHRCGVELGMNDNLRAVIPMDEELKEIHDEIIE